MASVFNSLVVKFIFRLLNIPHYWESEQVSLNEMKANKLFHWTEVECILRLVSHMYQTVGVVSPRLQWKPQRIKDIIHNVCSDEKQLKMHLLITSGPIVLCGNVLVCIMGRTCQTG